jgi:XTP/dITP diphosphohydrolase
MFYSIDLYKISDNIKFEVNLFFCLNQYNLTFDFDNTIKHMKLVFATNNLNKLKEVQRLISQHIKLLSLKDIGCFDDIPETQNTIKANALQKAKYIAAHYGCDCFADDTGLEVDALNGAPGVYSARYAGEQRNANNNMDKVLQELETKLNRSAQFKTVIALHLNGELHTFTGICKGEITKTKKGNKGFGYDPIFKPSGYNQTFAEMGLELKNRIGHRGEAINKLIKFLNKT